MTHQYNIAGMTCSGCVAKVKDALLRLSEVTGADVQQQSPQATIAMQQHIPLKVLQEALQKAGNYTIVEADSGMHTVESTTAPGGWWTTYKPVLLVFLYILIVTVITATSGSTFNLLHAMQVFMSGFFLVFSFFKMLDLKGFAGSYATYDIIAKRLPAWGVVYAFIELGLGIAFAVHFYPVVTNIVTLVVMLVSIIGVLQSVLNKRKIRCACLGTVFNLPMSTITIIEDALMIVMSAWMLINII